MITENSKIENTVIFSDDNTHRYLLSRIWNTSKEIPLFITKTAGQANGVLLDLTTNIISSNLYKLGYGGFYAVNLCSAIDSKAEQLYDKDTDVIIKKYLKSVNEVIIAWGTLTNKTLKKREEYVLDMLHKSNKKLLCLTDDLGHMNVHPLTPSVRKDFYIAEFK